VTTPSAMHDIRMPQRYTGWRWGQISLYALLHVSALFAPLHFTWSGLILMVVLLWACGGLGISLGWHRLNTHGSFKTSPTLRAILTALGCCSWQGGPMEWVGTHRRHHAHTDDVTLDPHTPRAGFFWAHAEWMFYNLPYNPYALTKDLQRHASLVWLEHWWWTCAWGLVVVLYLTGQAAGGLGLSWVLWAGSVRSVVLLHATWFVNSAAHTWGYRNFETRDDSKNNAWVAWFSFGEGWHNNHHAQPRSAAHGMVAHELDVTYLTIKLLARLGLVWDVVRPVLPTRRGLDPAATSVATTAASGGAKQSSVSEAMQAGAVHHSPSER